MARGRLGLPHDSSLGKYTFEGMGFSLRLSKKLNEPDNNGRAFNKLRLLNLS